MISGRRAPAGVSAAVLAGGRSRRMGCDKAQIELGGRRLIDRTLHILLPLFAEIRIIANDPAPFAGCGVDLCPDRFPGCGVLGGIQAALAASEAPRVFCIACDMPFAEPAVILHLAALSAGWDAVVPRTPAGLEPLHAVYGRECLAPLEALIRAGEFKAARLFDRVATRIVQGESLRRLDPELRGFFNLNTPADLLLAEQVLGERRAPGAERRTPGTES
jgi:molybdopterin-guanine dinucleotide biosynthesis protein A